MNRETELVYGQHGTKPETEKRKQTIQMGN